MKKEKKERDPKQMKWYAIWITVAILALGGAFFAAYKIFVATPLWLFVTLMVVTTATPFLVFVASVTGKARKKDVKNKTIYISLAATLIIGGVNYALFLGKANVSGRKFSRYLGKDFRQIIEVENLNSVEDVFGMSYDHGPVGTTAKNVTFLANDGYIYTQEFVDDHIAEGLIRWVPHDESQSMIRSRKISRWTKVPVELKLPDDFARMEGVAITTKAIGERAKVLNYWSTDGRFLSREYRDGLIERNFEGWIEIVPKGGKEDDGPIDSK